MSNNARSESTSESRDFAGSIQSMNLGSFSVDQVAELINWSNAGNFSFPKRQPWVDIESSQQSASQTPPVDSSNKHEISPNAFVPADDEPQSQVGQTESRVDEIEILAPEQSAPQTSTGDATAEDSEFKAELHDSSNSEPLSMEDSISGAQTSDEVSDSSSDIALQSSSSPDDEVLDPLSDAASKSKRAIMSPESVAHDASVSKAPTSPGVNTPIAMTSTSQTTPVQVREAVMNETQDKPTVDSSEYLRRLETLVLDLNMQLARMSGDAADQDANVTKWLRKRVIDLSLENLALHEKLSTPR